MKYNKLIKFLSLSLVLSFIFVGCEQEVANDNNLSKNFVGLSQSARSIYLDIDQTASVEAKVIAGHAVKYDRTIELEIIYSSVQNTAAEPNKVPVTTANSANFTVPASVVIPAGETVVSFPVTMNSADLGDGKTIVISIVPKEGIDVDTKFAGVRGNVGYEIMSPRLVLKFRPLCNYNAVQIQIVTDQYGSETTWELYDADFNLIASGGPFDDLDGAGITEQEPFDICLTSGSYTFVAYDSESDGMNAGLGEGFYRLVNMNSDFSVEGQQIVKNGVFGANDVFEFTLP